MSNLQIPALTLRDDDFPLLTQTIINQIGIEKNSTVMPFGRLVLLNTALDALQPYPPNPNTAWFDNSILLDSSTTPNIETTTITNQNIDLTNNTTNTNTTIEPVRMAFASPSNTSELSTTGTFLDVISSGQIRFNTNSVERLSISTTGIFQFQGGATYTPATSTFSATNFTGTISNITATSDNTSGTYYPIFTKTSGTGSKSLFIDDVSSPLTYNPSTGTLTTTVFSGSATGINVTATTNTNTNYPLIFCTSASTNQQLRADATALFFNPLSDTLTCPNFNGTVNNINVTSDNTSGTYYVPFVKTSGTGSKALFMDDITSPLTYNPNISTLQINNTLSNKTNAINETMVKITDGSTGKSTEYNYTSIESNGIEDYVLDNQGSALNGDFNSKFIYRSGRCDRVESINSSVGDHIEIWGNHYVSENGDDVFLYRVPKYQNQFGKGDGWYCHLTNLSGGNINLSSDDGTEFVSHTNNISAGSMIIKKYATVRITLIWAPSASQYYWVVSEF
jgi:hypothetical protein